MATYTPFVFKSDKIDQDIQALLEKKKARLAQEKKTRNMIIKKLMDWAIENQVQIAEALTAELCEQFCSIMKISVDLKDGKNAPENHPHSMSASDQLPDNN